MTRNRLAGYEGHREAGAETLRVIVEVMVLTLVLVFKLMTAAIVTTHVVTTVVANRVRAVR